MEGDETAGIGPVDIDWIKLTRAILGVIGVAGVLAGDADAPGGENLPVRDKGSNHFHAAGDGFALHLEVRRGVGRIPIERCGIIEQQAGEHGLAIHGGQLAIGHLDQGGVGSQGGRPAGPTTTCASDAFLNSSNPCGSDPWEGWETELAGHLAGKPAQVSIRL